MTDNDKILQDYIHKLYQLKDNSGNKPMSEEQLKQIAFEIGMTESEWLQTQTLYKNHLAKANTFLSMGNWDSAYQEYDNAVSIHPYSLEALYGQAQSARGKWLATNDNKWETKAIELANRCQQVSPGHRPSAQLLTDFYKSKSSSKKGMNKKMLKVLAAVAIVAVISIFVYLNLQNRVIEKEEEVAMRWAQVENVYERRAYLVEELVAVVKAAGEYEKGVLESVAETNKTTINLHINADKLSEEEITEYQKHQNQLTAEVRGLMKHIGKMPEINATENYRDLQAQLEGSANRIAVERQRFNKAVKEYNSMIKRFPYNLFGEPKGYFEVGEEVFDKVKIEF